MTRRLIATVLAAAMAITSVNVGTAQAGDRDVARIIVGATALAIIGSALAAENRNKSVTVHNTQPPRYRNDDHRRYDDRRYNNRNQYNHRYKKQRPVSVPRNCLMNVRAHNGWTQGYAARCAQNNTRAALPSDCVRRNFAQGPRLFYSPQCLRRNGFNA